MELDNEEDNPITGVIDNNENEFIGSDVVGFVSTTNVYDYNNYYKNNQSGVRQVIDINTTDLDV